MCIAAAAAAAKLLQSCPTLCDPIDGSPPGSPVPGILQARALEWVRTEALFTIAKTWKQSNCPSTEEWIKKMWCIYTMECYSAVDKNEIMSYAAPWVNLEISEVREGGTNIL